MTQSKRLFEVRDSNNKLVGEFDDKMVAKEARNKYGRTKDDSRWLARVTYGRDHDKRVQQ